MDLLRLCQGGVRRSWAGSSECPRPPHEPAEPIPAATCPGERPRNSRTWVPLISISSTEQRVKVGKRSLLQFSRGRRLFGTEGSVLLRCQGSDSSCLCARKIILFM